jgi:hypothetical protein
MRFVSRSQPINTRGAKRVLAVGANPSHALLTPHERHNCRADFLGVVPKFIGKLFCLVR